MKMKPRRKPKKGTLLDGKPKWLVHVAVEYQRRRDEKETLFTPYSTIFLDEFEEDSEHLEADLDYFLGGRSMPVGLLEGLDDWYWLDAIDFLDEDEKITCSTVPKLHFTPVVDFPETLPNPDELAPLKTGEVRIQPRKTAKEEMKAWFEQVIQRLPDKAELRIAWKVNSKRKTLHPRRKPPIDSVYDSPSEWVVHIQIEYQRRRDEEGTLLTPFSIIYFDDKEEEMEVLEITIKDILKERVIPVALLEGLDRWHAHDVMDYLEGGEKIYCFTKPKLHMTPVLASWELPDPKALPLYETGEIRIHPLEGARKEMETWFTQVIERLPDKAEVRVSWKVD
jgi:hypothetical protein